VRGDGVSRRTSSFAMTVGSLSKAFLNYRFLPYPHAISLFVCHYGAKILKNSSSGTFLSIGTPLDKYFSENTIKV